MRNDVVIGVGISAAIHAGVLFGGALLPNHPAIKRIIANPPAIVIEQPPRIEPDEPEKVETITDPVRPQDYAPPMQPDVPQVVPKGGFTQKLQPPLPEGPRPTSGMIEIPENRQPGRGMPCQIFDPASLDQQPVARVRAQPEYPFEMKRQGVTGDVCVDFIVTPNGDVENAYATKSSQREFEQAAVQAVSKWKFRPGKKAGRFVYVHMQVPIVFTLNDR